MIAVESFEIICDYGALTTYTDLVLLLDRAPLF